MENVNFVSYAQALLDTCKQIDQTQITNFENALWNSLQNGNRIFVLGNGGSAAAASHWVCDFGKGINIPGKKRMKIQAFSENISILTAYGNDISYDDIFSEQLENHMQKDDLVVCLSVSGNSKNLVKALETARRLGGKTAGILADFNGACRPLCDILVDIPTKNYGIAEDIHLMLNHNISQNFKKRLSE